MFLLTGDIASAAPRTKDTTLPKITVTANTVDGDPALYLIGLVMAREGMFLLIRIGTIVVVMERTPVVMVMAGMRFDMLSRVMPVSMGMSPRRQNAVGQVQQHGGKGDELEQPARH